MLTACSTGDRSTPRHGVLVMQSQHRNRKLSNMLFLLLMIWLLEAFCHMRSDLLASCECLPVQHCMRDIFQDRHARAGWCCLCMTAIVIHVTAADQNVHLDMSTCLHKQFAGGLLASTLLWLLPWAMVGVHSLQSQFTKSLLAESAIGRCPISKIS